MQLSDPGGSENTSEPAETADPARPASAHGLLFTDREIAALFRSWDGLPGVLLAVSGGPDSVALMLLAAAWARGRPAGPWLRVATVDHGLRPQSRQEAEAVGSWAASLGLDHVILTWEGPKPKARIQELARAKRYELLLAHADEIGAAAVATAHHADDQAETILFRLLRGSGLAGLAGMTPSSERDGHLISRPLLGCRKDDLVACCEAAGHPYVRDPSNHDPAFARTRIRDLLARLEPEGLDRHRLLELGRRAARAEAALADRARHVGATLEVERTPERVIADASKLAAEPDEIVLRVLASEIKSLNEGRAIRLDRLESLLDRFCLALRSGTRLDASLGGTLVELDPRGKLTLRREPERRRGRAVRSALP